MKLYDPIPQNTRQRDVLHTATAYTVIFLQTTNENINHSIKCNLEIGEVYCRKLEVSRLGLPLLS